MEVFTASGADGGFEGVMLTVPPRCGLQQADTLRVDGLTTVALRRNSVLPLELPMLNPPSRESLLLHARTGQRLVVAEFTPLGLLNAYFLNLIVTA